MPAYGRMTLESNVFILPLVSLLLSFFSGRQMTEWHMFRLNSYICVPTFFITFILLFLMPLAGRWQNDKWRGWIHIYAYLSSLYLLFCFFWCHWPADDRMTDGEIEFIYLCTYILHTFYFALSDATGRQMTEWHQKDSCISPLVSILPYAGKWENDTWE